MKNKTLLLICLVFAVNCLKAQNARFPTDGIIEFEKSTNMHALVKKMADKNSDSYFREAFDAFKKSNPQFKIQRSTLAFSKSKTLFTPLADKETSRSIFSELAVDQCNITYTDLTSETFITQKKVYEETFLVKDTTRKINWKITNEVRTIAGYECRRANAVILDSIYVVAFYTDKIPVSGGPESFTGLPGMILGVALPHENVTWFAKTVTDRSLAPNELKAPVKGKATDNKGLRATINTALKDWGDYAQSALKTFLL